ncbi:MAG: flagellar motor switch phosphatase FliY, partial [Peptococcaceae bacterium]|nr:flagellar motor switch phosphatase FliY [Peptococcaceae bacterium]
MGNGMLSQEEIDALLSGSLDDDSPLEEDSTQDSTPEEEIISVLEKDAIGELANISMGTAATTLSQLVGKRVEITTPKVDLATVRQIVDEYPVPYLLVDVRYKRGIKGSNMLVLSREDGS